MIKSAASTASRKTECRGPRSRAAPRAAAVRLPSRCPGVSLDLKPLDLVYLKAALAVHLITASTSKQKKPSQSKKNNLPGHKVIKKESQVIQNGSKNDGKLHIWQGTSRRSILDRKFDVKTRRGPWDLPWGLKRPKYAF